MAEISHAIRQEFEALIQEWMDNVHYYRKEARILDSPHLEEARGEAVAYESCAMELEGLLVHLFDGDHNE